MKLILSVSPIKPSLTGIGRYTWELATRLPQLGQTETIKYFNNGKWVDDVATLMQRSEASLAAQRKLADSRLVRDAYSLLSPFLFRWQLKEYSDFIYHGPNFYLPKFPGKSVVTIHDLSILRFPQYHPPGRVAFVAKQIEASLKYADYVITISDYIRDEIIEYCGWPADKISTTHLGVAPEFVARDATQTQSVMQRHGLVHGTYTLCVATIEPRKNIEQLIDAYSNLPSSLRHQYPLVLAGGKGWRSEAIHERIKQGQAEGWLKYLGYVVEDDLPMLYAGARGFAFLSHYEGFGLPVLEAMACGIPTLISDRASLPEVAQGAASIVQVGDVSGTTESLRKILEEDDAWRTQVSMQSARIAHQSTWQKTAEKTAAVYAALNNCSNANLTESRVAVS